MTAFILLLIPVAILAIFLVPKSKNDIPDDGVTVGAGDVFPKGGAIQLGAPERSNTGFSYHDTFYCTNINHED